MKPFVRLKIECNRTNLGFIGDRMTNGIWTPYHSWTILKERPYWKLVNATLWYGNKIVIDLSQNSPFLNEKMKADLTRGFWSYVGIDDRWTRGWNACGHAIMFWLAHKNGLNRILRLLAICWKLIEIIFNFKHHYIWGRPNWHLGADYIGKKNLSQKCGDLRFIEIILRRPALSNVGIDGIM